MRFVTRTVHAYLDYPVAIKSDGVAICTRPWSR